MDSEFQEPKIEITSFVSWEEWIYVIELLCPNIASLPELKATYNQSKAKEALPYYYSFILDSLLNTQEKLKNGLKMLDSILSRNSKQNPLSVLATNQFLSHYLSIKYDEKYCNYQAILLDIIRTSSQLSDIYQDSHKMNKSISQVLESVHMNEGQFIAEIRHKATHKQMPSKLLTRKSVEYLLVFLLENYWSKIYQKIKKEIPKEINVKVFIEKDEGFEENERVFVINKEKNLFQNKNLRFFKMNVKTLVADLAKNEDLEAVEEVFRDFRRNLNKNKFKCAVFLGEIIREIINFGVGLGENVKKIESLKGLMVRIIEMKEKKMIGRLFRFPFIKYKLLRLISLKEINKSFGMILDIFFERFYAKNDRNMVFMKGFEEVLEENCEKKQVSTEEMEVFLKEFEEK